MFLLGRPTNRDVQQFLERSRELSLSYSPVGIARPGAVATGWTIDETVTPLGEGEVIFERAKTALRAWAHFDVGWIELHPTRAGTEPGTNVAVLIRHLGFWSLNGSRIVYALDENGGTEFGFAYGTLGNHGEAGEEIFKVTFDPTTGQVNYVLRAASRPRALLARLGYPVVRWLQGRFRRDSGLAMQRASRRPGL